MKKIRFPLDMKNGIKVWELDEFREHFDLEKAVEYFGNGKLQRWLKNTYNDDILEEIEGLHQADEDFIQKFTEALGVEICDKNLNVQEIIRNSSLKEKLKRYLPEEEIEKIYPSAATTQEELEHLTTRKLQKIYLVSNTFFINRELKNIEFIGIGNPKVRTEITDIQQFRKQKIYFRDVIPYDAKTATIISASSMLKIFDLLEMYLKK